LSLPEIEEDNSNVNLDALKNHFSLSYLLSNNYLEKEVKEKVENVDGEGNAEKPMTKKRKKRVGGKPNNAAKKS
jgi:hypothetical protein